MPHKQVTFERWQVSAFLLAIAVSFVYVGVALNHRVSESESAIIAQRELSKQRLANRKASDRALCVYVRDHVVIPDRKTVLGGPLAAVPALRLLGFDQAKIDRYLAFQYGGVPVKELERIGIAPTKARQYARGRRDGVADNLASRPIPDCSQPLNLGGG